MAQNLFTRSWPGLSGLAALEIWTCPAPSAAPPGVRGAGMTKVRC